MTVLEAYKRFTSLASRVSDFAGTVDLGYSNHGLTAASATITLRFLPAPATIASLNTGTEVITTTAAHLLATGDRVQVSSTGTLPGGLAANTSYYVEYVTGTTLKLQSSLGGSVVNLTSAGSGTHTITPQDEAACTGMSIDSVAGSVLTLSSGGGHLLPLSGTAISVECASNRFFLPDLRGRVAVGAGQGSGLTNRSSGSSFGEENHQLTISEMPSHTHNRNSSGHEEQVIRAGSSGGIREYDSGSRQSVNATTTASSGGDSAHNTMQPSLVMNYIIKA